MTDSTPEPKSLRERAEAFLVQCGSCDTGLLMMCTCPYADPRPLIADLLKALDAERKMWDEIKALATEFKNCGCSDDYCPLLEELREALNADNR
jgi:hypothetical protein